MGLFSKKRRRLPGAVADWDESKHIDLGNNRVVIPEDQLPAEAVRRLTGVVVYSPPNGGTCVMVNVEAAKAEARAQSDELIPAYSQSTVSQAEFHARMKRLNWETLNNTDHWLHDENELIGDTTYTLFHVNPVTGLIGEP